MIIIRNKIIFKKWRAGGEEFVSSWCLAKVEKVDVASGENDRVVWSWRNGGEEVLGRMLHHFLLYNSMQRGFFNGLTIGYEISSDTLYLRYSLVHMVVGKKVIYIKILT